MPGANAELGSMRQFMFDPTIRTKLGRFEVAVLRAALASKEHELFWSEREILLAKVEDSVLKKAKERGVSHDKYRDELISKPEEVQAFASLVADAMSELVPSKQEKRIADLEAKLKAAEEQIRRMRAQKNG